MTQKIYYKLTMGEIRSYPIHLVREAVDEAVADTKRACAEAWCKSQAGHYKCKAKDIKYCIENPKIQCIDIRAIMSVGKE